MSVLSNSAARDPSQGPLQAALDRTVDCEPARGQLKQAGAAVPLAVQGTIQGVTGRRRAEQARAYLAAIVQSSEDAIIGGTLDGFVTAWNPSAERLYGYSAAEMIGQPISRLVPPELQDQALANRERMHGGERIAYQETVRLHKDGRRLEVAMTVSPIYNEAGMVIGAASISRDISARKRADREREQLLASERAAREELLRAQSQLVQQERLRALGEMSSGVAHDFNNALAPIVGYSELLLLRPELRADAETTTEYLRRISTAAQDAASVVNRLREFYRPRELDDEIEEIDLTQLIKQVVDLTRPKWRDQARAEGIDIHVRPQLSRVPPIAGHGGELREMLTNLLFNAVHALPAGGTITLGTREEQGEAVLTVSDTGIGMTDEVRHRCLEPFFTTKGNRGTGLGLAMVYGIIQRHGGTVDIASAPGNGTTFTIRFPQATGILAPNDAVGILPVHRPLRVLVVDDDERVADITSNYVSLDGHTPVSVRDGDSALKEFLSGTFDVVITDQAMRGMSGEQLARAIKEISPTTPVILLTGFGSLMQVAGDRPAGVDWIVNKPATAQDVRRALARVVEA
jgi:PAS domain S-box-containing protein